MLTLGMTAGEDNTAIWLVRITLASSTLRYATKSITLSSNLYNGEILGLDDGRGFNIKLSNEMVGIDSLTPLPNLSTLSFTIANWTGTYIDDFYPSTGKPYITGKRVELGLVWDTATTEAEITWLWDGYVYEYSSRPNGILITAIQRADLENTPLPFYKIQADYDDGISYFPKAPDSNLQNPISLVYGDFPLITYTAGGADYMTPNLGGFVPIQSTDEENYGFVISSHRLKSIYYQPYKRYVGGSTDNNTTPDIYKYVPELDVYMNQYQYKSSTKEFYQTVTNTFSSAKFDLGRLQTDYAIETDIATFFKAIKPEGEVYDLDDLSAIDTSTYYDLDGADSIYTGFEFKEDFIPNLGDISTTNSEIVVLLLVANLGGSTRTLRISTDNPSSVTTKFTDFNISASGLSLCIHSLDIFATDQWRNVFNTSYRIENRETAGNPLRIYFTYLMVTRVPVEGLSRDTKFERQGYVNVSKFFFVPNWKRLKDITRYVDNEVNDFSPSAQGISCAGRMFE